MSNRVVTYIDINLNSIEAYWSELIVPSAKAFYSEPSPRSLFHVAGSLWHLHDWVWHDRNPGQNSRGPIFDTFRNNLLQQCPELGWLRDLTDASKHRGLGRLPEVQGAEPQWILSALSVHLGSLGHELKFFIVLNDGSRQYADEVVHKAIEFWRADLSAKNLPAV
ncbi:hypothetical protein H8A99_10375 [Bradyrhizobium sp. Arg68]|uniref:hypothetical protein n=1 Tax=Bradyrhizobium ivorense TaxID=2511166 RepID=UPI001E3AEA73|nr:hypothetical protein [Bradyrhizobium ivorense]MCC8936880.1 hypothetical protein [Bradyrhizobium ivorense]